MRHGMMGFLMGLVLTAAAPAWAFEVVSGCQPEDYVVGTAPIEEGETIRLVKGYTPKCLKVSRGTSVTIQASKGHPLQALADVGGVVNPFRGETEHVKPQSHVLSEPGFYGYYCTDHGDTQGRGMAGSIWVE